MRPEKQKSCDLGHSGFSDPEKPRSVTGARYSKSYRARTKNSASFAIFAATRRASFLLSTSAAEHRPLF
jgi:hypothetical protein